MHEKVKPNLHIGQNFGDRRLCRSHRANISGTRTIAPWKIAPRWGDVFFRGERGGAIFRGSFTGDNFQVTDIDINTAGCNMKMEADQN